MTASTATTVPMKTQTTVQLIAAQAIRKDRTLRRRIELVANGKGNGDDAMFVAGAVLGAMAVARPWVKSAKLTAMAFANVATAKGSRRAHPRTKR